MTEYEMNDRWGSSDTLALIEGMYKVSDFMFPQQCYLELIESRNNVELF